MCSFKELIKYTFWFMGVSIKIQSLLAEEMLKESCSRLEYEQVDIKNVEIRVRIKKLWSSKVDIKCCETTMQKTDATTQRH